MGQSTADGRFNDLSTKWVTGSIAVGAVVLFLLGHFGKEGQGRIASFAVASIMIAMRMCWPLRSSVWFWPLFGLIWCIHGAIVFAVPWPDPHYPALLLAPFAAADIAVIIHIVSFIENITTSKGGEEGEDDGH